MNADDEWPTENPRQVSATAGVLAATSGALLALAETTSSNSGSAIAVTLAMIGVIAAVYEFAAIYTNDFPTITEHLTRNGWVVRIGAIVLGALAWVDHLGPGLIF